MESLTPYLIAVPALLILSVVASKGAGRFGIPALSIFLLIGMAVGREGPGGVPFSNYVLAQTLGIIALIQILHSGGLSTRIEDVRAVRWSALVLSTVGVVIATALVGAFAIRFLALDWLHGLLLGAAIASTDVAAVFTILRSRNVSLQGRIRPLLELESALNDPMTVFLSVGLLGLIVRPDAASPARLIATFFQQMIVGTLAGIVGGRATRWAINWIKLEFEGLYPVLSVALVVLTYGVTQSIGGSGFLAVYVSGIVLGNTTYVHKRSLTVFHDGLAWLMQIVMFLTMGLLVLPTELSRMAVSGIALSAFLVLVARPVSVLVCLTPFRFSWQRAVDGVVGRTSWRRADRRRDLPADCRCLRGADDLQPGVFRGLHLGPAPGNHDSDRVCVAQGRLASRESLPVSDRVQSDHEPEERARGSPRAIPVGGDRPVARGSRVAGGRIDRPDSAG